MKNWKVNENSDVVCVFCGAIIMTREENIEQAPTTAGLYSSSNSAEMWEPACPNDCAASIEAIYE